MDLLFLENPAVGEVNDRVEDSVSEAVGKNVEVSVQAKYTVTVVGIGVRAKQFAPHIVTVAIAELQVSCRP
jgi:hypothetical protein